MIHELRDKKIMLAIATTTTLENVTSLLKSTLGEESIDWFDVIGAGDIVPMKKTDPDIYHWVLNQLKLDARQCIAIEDSENGLKSAMAANLLTLITVNGYTHLQDFSGALAILSDLGEPEKPFTQISGETFKQQWIDYEILNGLLK